MNNGFDYDSFASDFPNLYPDEKLSVLFSGYDNPDDIIGKITSDYGIQYVAKTKFGCEQFEILEERKLKGQELNYLQQYANENIAFWIGYMYRYIADSLGISSSDVVKNVDYCKMLQMYEGFHTVDEDLMVEKLNETCFFVFDDSKCAEWNMEK